MPNWKSEESRDVFRQQFKKTRLCKFRKSGCARGAECRYAHSQSELRQAPSLVKTSICMKWKVGCCPFPAKQCYFAHGVGDIRVTVAFADYSKQRTAEALQRARVEAAEAAADRAGGEARPPPAFEGELAWEDGEAMAFYAEALAVHSEQSTAADIHQVMSRGNNGQAERTMVQPAAFPEELAFESEAMAFHAEALAEHSEQSTAAAVHRTTSRASGQARDTMVQPAAFPEELAFESKAMAFLEEALAEHSKQSTAAAVHQTTSRGSGWDKHRVVQPAAFPEELAFESKATALHAEVPAEHGEQAAAAAVQRTLPVAAGWQAAAVGIAPATSGRMVPPAALPRELASKSEATTLHAEVPAEHGEQAAVAAVQWTLPVVAGWQAAAVGIAPATSGRMVPPAALPRELASKNEATALHAEVPAEHGEQAAAAAVQWTLPVVAGWQAAAVGIAPATSSQMVQPAALPRELASRSEATPLYAEAPAERRQRAAQMAAGPGAAAGGPAAAPGGSAEGPMARQRGGGPDYRSKAMPLRAEAPAGRRGRAAAAQEASPTASGSGGRAGSARGGGARGPEVMQSMLRELDSRSKADLAAILMEAVPDCYED